MTTRRWRANRISIVVQRLNNFMIKTGCRQLIYYEGITAGNLQY